MIKLILIWQGRHHCMGLHCPQYCLFSKSAVTLEMPGGESAFFPPKWNKSHLPNSCIQVVSCDVIGRIFQSILFAICLVFSIFASFYLLVHSDVLNLSSLDLLVYLLFHLFVSWLSDSSLISVAPLCLFSKTLGNPCLMLSSAKSPWDTFRLMCHSSIISKQVLSSVVNTS